MFSLSPIAYTRPRIRMATAIFVLWRKVVYIINHNGNEGLLSIVAEKWNQERISILSILMMNDLAVLVCLSLVEKYFAQGIPPPFQYVVEAG